jgi:TPR repeat protein
LDGECIIIIIIIGNRSAASTLWQQAIPELKVAADAGDPRAQHELAGAYERGHGGLMRDRVLSRHYSMLAAIQGHAVAQVTLYFFNT